MKKSTGRKIIILADVLQTIGIMCLSWSGMMIIFAIIIIVGDGDLVEWNIMLAVPLLIGISSYISSLLVRGYGSLIENSDALRQKADVIIELLSKQKENQSLDQICCSVCDTSQSRDNKFCKKCGIPLGNFNETHQ